MIILGLDTSSKKPAIAVVDFDPMTARFALRASIDFGALASEQTVSSGLIPVLRQALTNAETRVSDLNLIAVTIGPGSFTGLRIGIVVAKTLSYAAKIPLIGINTLEAIAIGTAAQLNGEVIESQGIHAVLNAQRGQLFAGQFRLEMNDRQTELSRNANFHDRPLPRIRCIESTQLLDRRQWLAQLRPGDLVTGSGLPPLLSLISAMPGIQIAPNQWWDPSAEWVARIGVEYFQQGRVDDLWTLQPYYFRPSAAEEKRIVHGKQLDPL